MSNSSGLVEGLTPAQQETLDLIRVPQEDRTVFPSSLRAELYHRLEKETVEVADALTSDLWVAKRQLQAVNSCETLYMAQTQEEFRYSVPTSRGQIFHKAVELSVHLPSILSPSELVGHAFNSLSARDDSLSHFLTESDAVTAAEIRSECVSLLTTFQETFPPLRSAWRPTTEASRRVSFHRNKIILAGRFDLTLGMPTDRTADRVIIELKTGKPSIQHADDQRYYALLETLVTGVPPLLLASFYVDAGRVVTENVDEALLESTLRRTIAGVKRLGSLRLEDVQPKKLPGPPCRWCPVSNECAEGSEWLKESTETNGW